MTPFSGKSFGDVSSDGDVRTSSAYSVGDTVKAWFIGANPRVRTRLQLYPKDNDTLFFFLSSPKSRFDSSCIYLFWSAVVPFGGSSLEVSVPTFFDSFLLCFLVNHLGTLLRSVTK